MEQEYDYDLAKIFEIIDQNQNEISNFIDGESGAEVYYLRGVRGKSSVIVNKHKNNKFFRGKVIDRSGLENSEEPVMYILSPDDAQKVFERFENINNIRPVKR